MIRALEKYNIGCRAGRGCHFIVNDQERSQLEDAS